MEISEALTRCFSEEDLAHIDYHFYGSNVLNILNKFVRSEMIDHDYHAICNLPNCTFSIYSKN